jgi:hypothetical protein
MAIIYLSGNRIQGLSSDTKPTLVPTNSTFLETDTGLSFLFNGATYDQIGGDGVGDLEFIRDQIIAGNWITAHGDIDGINEKITIIPANGKTFFLHSAKITSTGLLPQVNVTNNTVNVNRNQVGAQLVINLAIEDTTQVGTLATSNDVLNTGVSGGINVSVDGRFDAIGLFLIGTGSLTVTIENILDNGSADATMSGWIQDS